MFLYQIFQWLKDWYYGTKPEDKKEAKKVDDDKKTAVKDGMV